MYISCLKEQKISYLTPTITGMVVFSFENRSALLMSSFISFLEKKNRKNMNSFLLANMANPCDQLEPAAKSVRRGNIYHSKFLIAWIPFEISPAKICFMKEK